MTSCPQPLDHFIIASLVDMPTQRTVGLQVTQKQQLPQEWAERLQKELQ